MNSRPTTSRLANETARAIHEAFAEFHETFLTITRRASERFRNRDWHGMQADAKERLQLRAIILGRLLARIRGTLADRVADRNVWIGTKAVYSGLIDQRDDWEIAETFFNSVTRRVFTTVGVNSEIEFVHTDYVSPPCKASREIPRPYWSDQLGPLLAEILCHYTELGLTQASARHDASLVADRVREKLRYERRLPTQWRVEVADTVFYRGERAYLVCRISLDDDSDGYIPLVLCFLHREEEPRVDAVLLEPDDLGLLFSYTRSYMHVVVERPYDLVQFIKSIVPRKSRAEIYISMGYHRHGKTELYRHALRHLAQSTDLYQRAAGQRGMVMVVFTMPSYPVVFKIIRDRFEYPKQCTRQDVIDHYHLVFEHDRAGRLIDAQEYEYLVLNRRRFAEDLLEELLAVAGETVSVQGDQVVIQHCYAERRVSPLDVYLREAEPAAARAAVIDYGQAIKDLAVTNLFPGDLLLKNFGVTRQNRVVFYDYDEVCLVTDCNFRRLPQTDNYEDELSAEPWFGVGQNDIFPEEFERFLGLSDELKAAFIENHRDLLRKDYWRRLQQRLAAGELFYVPPYHRSKKIIPDSASPARILAPTTRTVA